MIIHVQTFGPSDMGALGNAAAIDQVFEFPVSDQPLIEITLDNGAVIHVAPRDARSITVRDVTMGGRIAVVPESGNQFVIITRV